MTRLADVPRAGTRHRFTAKLESARTMAHYNGEIDAVTLVGVVHVETGRLVCKRLFFRVGYLNGPGWESEYLWDKRGQFAAFTAQFRGLRRAGTWQLFRPAVPRWHRNEDTLPRPADDVPIDPKSGFPEADLPRLLPGRLTDDTTASWGRRATAELCQKWGVSRPIAERVVREALAERNWQGEQAR
jgi:hypothetical protein